VFLRYAVDTGNDVLVVANFDGSPQSLDLADLRNRGSFRYNALQDLCTGQQPSMFKNQLVVPPYRFYWLTDGGLY
jgi:amylosucrase